MADKMKNGDMVDIVSFTYQDDTSYSRENNPVSVVVKKDCVVSKAGFKTFNAAGRRLLQGAEGEFLDGSFRNSRRAYVRTGEPLQALIKEAERLITQRARADLDRFERMAKHAELRIASDTIIELDVYKASEMDS
ncbi:hypothetical protein [Vibrio crassostreae]|uniref:hypothetical protein n=1 Tax=Vibrio crassostreae TaxID=246167 RepID=UPI001B30A12B|nr:hypothetical protein [Vibrio crassostreae]